MLPTKITGRGSCDGLGPVKYGSGGETHGGSSPPFGTMAITKGNPDWRRVPFFVNDGESGWKVACRINLVKLDHNQDQSERPKLACLTDGTDDLILNLHHPD